MQACCCDRYEHASKYKVLSELQISNRVFIKQKISTTKDEGTVMLHVSYKGAREVQR